MAHLIRCIIIDDERLAREYISNYVSKIPQLELVGTFNSPLKAMELITANEVDLMFLDIQMPDITGVDFLRSLTKKPDVIFTTAYQEYALEGFNLSAMDYLLKPFPFDRFLSAVNKVIRKQEALHKISTLNEVEIPEVPIEPLISENFITIKADRKIYKINFSDIEYIEGQKAYVTFHTKRKNITALASLKELEDSLPTGQFIRIHKSYIISIDDIFSLEGNLIEIGDTKLPVGKSYKDAVLKLLGE